MEARARYQFCPHDGETLKEQVSDDRVLLVCAKCGFVDYQNPKPAVAAVIVRDGKVLLARRAIEPAKGRWDIVGGFVEAGESAEAAAIREVLEETSLDVRVAGFLGSFPDVYGARQEPTLNLGFLVEVVSGTPNPRSDVDALTWFSWDALPDSMAFEHQQQILDTARARLETTHARTVDAAERRREPR